MTADALALVPENAELEVIAGSLFNPQVYAEARAIVRADQFWHVEYSLIWTAMNNLYLDGKEPDLTALSDELKRLGHEEISAGRLAELSIQTFYSRNAPQHAATVAEYGRRRALTECLPQIKQVLLDDSKDYDEAVSEATEIYNGALDGEIRSAEFTLEQITEQAENHIFAVDEQPGVSFMLSELNQICGVMIPGDAVLIAARTGIGKTRYCTQLALTQAQHGSRVLFMTTEEAEYQTAWRLIEMMSRGALKVKDMRSGLIRKEQAKAALYLEYAEKIKKLPIEIVRVNGWDVQRVTARIAKYPPGTYRVVLVDYLQRLGETPGWGKRRSDEELGHRMQVLKNAALDQQTVVVVPSQINRDGAGRDQGPEHLAGSDKIGHEADIMLSIQRDEGDGPIATFRIGKTRWGEGLGRKVEVYFDPDAGTYHNAARNHQEKQISELPPALRSAIGDA